MLRLETTKMSLAALKEYYLYCSPSQRFIIYQRIIQLKKEADCIKLRLNSRSTFSELMKNDV
jgi:hypothetical protein